MQHACSARAGRRKRRLAVLSPAAHATASAPMTATNFVPSPNTMSDRPRPQAPCAGAVYATLLAGTDGYAKAALCLGRQLRVVGARCPLLVVFDDLSSENGLNASTYRSLALEMGGTDWLIPLSWLLKRSQGSTTLPSGLQLKRGAAEGSSSGSFQHWTLHTHKKLYLWALPPTRFPKVAMIDSDVVLLSSPDDALAVELTADKPIAAVACGTGKFNSGFVVFKPSLQVLGALMTISRFLRWPWLGRFPARSRYEMYRPFRPGGNGSLRLLPWADICAPAGCTESSCLPSTNMFPSLPPAAAFHECRKRHQGTLFKEGPVCESRYGDQTALNLLYARHGHNQTWTPLRNLMGLQTATRHVCSGPIVDASRPLGGRAVYVDFAGQTKPWLNKAIYKKKTFGSASPSGRRNVFTQLWQQRCLGVPPTGGADLTVPDLCTHFKNREAVGG